MTKRAMKKTGLVLTCVVIMTTVFASGCSDLEMMRRQPTVSPQSTPVESSSILAATATPTVPATQTVPASPTPQGPSVTSDPTPTQSDEPVQTAAAGVEADVQPSTSQQSAEAVAAAALETQVMQYMVTADKYYNQRGFSSNHYSFTAEELRMLAVVIYLEARGESYKAKVAVGNVVMNRVLASGYPGSTIREVVTAPNQFCYNSSVEPDADCLRAAGEVLRYETWVVPQNTYFFRSTGSTSNWGSHDYYKHIDSIAFYREAYSGRSNGSSIPARLFKRVYKWPQYGCEPGSRVRKIQTMLKALGYKVVVDGYFGVETKKQVIQFQKDHGLKVDGIVGPATLRKLIRLSGK